jgi:hypothetical protein
MIGVASTQRDEHHAHDGRKSLIVQFAQDRTSPMWAAVTAGRLVIALVAERVGSTRIYVVLPWVIGATLLIAPAAGEAAAGIAVFALAGLACSGYFPMTIGYGESSFPGMVELAAGWLIAAYQVGYGLAAFGGGGLQEAVSLTTRLTAVLAVLMGLMSVPSAGTLRRPAAVHRVETTTEPGGARRRNRDHPIWTMTWRAALRTVEPGPSPPTIPRS